MGISAKSPSVKVYMKDMCCGCRLCENYCPVHCISISNVKGGYIREMSEECIQCEKCDRICPINNDIRIEISKNKLLAVYCENYALKSSSGGVFGCLAEWWLKNGGVVYGACFNSKFDIVHRRIKSINELPQLLGSKYVNSNLCSEEIYSSICDSLQKKIHVLFSGTPCQIAAIRKSCAEKNIDMNNLLCIEIVCHGAPVPEVWKSYCKYLEIKYNSRIVKVNFRDKTYGWHSYSVAVEFENGKKLIEIMNVNSYMQAYLYGYSIMSSCSNCYFKENRQGDITLGDLWGINISSLKKYYKNGVSLVSVNTEKGDELIASVRKFLVIENIPDSQKKIALSNIKGKCTLAEMNERILFFTAIYSTGFKDAYHILVKNNKMRIIKDWIKGLIKWIRR